MTPVDTHIAGPGRPMVSTPRLRKRRFIWPGAMILLTVAGITILVRIAGTDSIAVHLYYLPIMYAGYMFGDLGAIAVSLLSTLLCGPWMPARYELDKPLQQAPADMIVRMCTFYVVGLAASRASLELRRRAQEAHLLYEVARSITSTLRLNEVLALITESAMKVMNAKGSVIRLLDAETDELVPKAMSGLSAEYWQKGRVVGTASPVNRKALEGHPVQILDVTAEEGFQYPEAAKVEGLSSVLTVPLRAKSGTCGVLRVYAARKKRFTPAEIELLTTFADQAAVAIENAELYEDIRRNYYETVRALTTAVEAKDAATYKHSERVTTLSDALAQAMGMGEADREMLRFGCILHDIGKIGVQDEALEARDDFETPEQVFYKMHPLIGASILQPIGFLEDALPIVKYHHEQWDGEGFPEGLSGRQIPLGARIAAIADLFDRTQRPGGSSGFALSTRDALQAVVSRAGSAFDPEIVGKFHKMMLSDNPLAGVAPADPLAPARAGDADPGAAHEPDDASVARDDE